MEDNYIDNLNMLRELASSIKALDLLDPSTRTVTILTEIIERCKYIPELEMIHHNPFMNIEEAEA